MIDIEEGCQRFIQKNTNKNRFTKDFLPQVKKFHEDEEVINERIALDRQDLEVLRTRIMAILIDELTPKKKSIRTELF